MECIVFRELSTNSEIGLFPLNLPSLLTFATLLREQKALHQRKGRADDVAGFS